MFGVYYVSDSSKFYYLKTSTKTILCYDTYRHGVVSLSSQVNFSKCVVSDCQKKYEINKKLSTTKPFDADAIIVQSSAIYALFPQPQRDQDQVFILAVRDSFPTVKSLRKSHKHEPKSLKALERYLERLRKGAKAPVNRLTRIIGRQGSSNIAPINHWVQKFENAETNNRELSIQWLRSLENDDKAVKQWALYFENANNNRRKLGKQWLGLFNWTMTYRLDSDIVYKYSNIVERNNKSDLFDKDYDGIFDKKEKDIAWLVSHCNTQSRRKDYVNDLMAVINVDIYGGCGKRASCPKGNHSCFDDIATKYKFYLAFENTFYADYVTEKLFNWFNRDIVVVVRGGANYSRLVPSGTIIDASDFESAADLGHFLKHLAADKNRYLSYLKQKDNYYATGKRDATQKAFCKLCEYQHALDKHKKTYDNMADWWIKGFELSGGRRN